VDTVLESVLFIIECRKLSARWRRVSVYVGGIVIETIRVPATQLDRQQVTDFAYEQLIGIPADMSFNSRKFQLPLAEIRGAPKNRWSEQETG